MSAYEEKANILLVDDQPAKLLSYEVILSELGETLIKASSAREALEQLLKADVAVVLIDVHMPEFDGFELAAMIREHPRFEKTAIIFVSAIRLTDLDRLRGYAAGAVDYVPVPVVPEVLRAKVKVFAELHRKTRQLERMNEELERRVAERTVELEASTEQLKESEQRRSLALAAGRMGSWDWDLVSGNHLWDEGQHRIFGVDPKTFIPASESILALVHPEDHDAYRKAAQQAVREGLAYDVEFRVLRTDGSLRWCVVGAAPTLDSAGRAVRLSGVTFDITERKEAEQATQRLNEELERRVEERTLEREQALAQLFEAQKMDTIGRLTGGVAHDFNNLLMAVLGSLDLLKKRLPPLDPRTTRLLDNAIQGAERGSALTQRLLAFARRQELKPETIDVAKLFTGMEDLLKRALGSTIRIGRDLPGDLAHVRVDANQLELALLNIALNARDAMPLGGSFSIAARNETIREPGATLPPGDYVRIRLTDTGVGMDETTVAKAAEPFFTTKGPGKGTGLGLSMVHGLAAQSGGMLQIASRPDQGTTVDLWLPKAEPTDVVKPETRERPNPEDIPAPPCTILVVDDDALVSAGTAAILEDLGHETIEANSGAQALDLLRSGRRVDIVITDQVMPGLTGIELARRIRATYPEIAIILATGYAEFPGSDENDAISLHRLSKPFRQKELATAIAHVARPASGIINVIPFRSR